MAAQVCTSPSGQPGGEGRSRPNQGVMVGIAVQVCCMQQHVQGSEVVSACWVACKHHGPCNVALLAYMKPDSCLLPADILPSPRRLCTTRCYCQGLLDFVRKHGGCIPSQNMPLHLKPIGCTPAALFKSACCRFCAWEELCGVATPIQELSWPCKRGGLAAAAEWLY